MNRLRKPRAAEVTSRLASTEEPFTYAEVGATRALRSESRAAVGAAYDVDRYEFDLGRGRERFERARAALIGWRQFEIPWVEFYGASRSAHTGQVVASLVSVAGLWFFNPCRVVYTELAEESDCAALAYGTLSGHVESGEERFEVRHDATSGEVHYRILAFSRPAILLTKLGYPAVRAFQRRFARASADALRRASA